MATRSVAPPPGRRGPARSWLASAGRRQLSVLALLLLAGVGCLPRPSPTPDAGVIDFQVAVIYPSATLTPSATPTLTPSRTPRPSPTLTPSSTLRPPAPPPAPGAPSPPTSAAAGTSTGAPATPPSPTAAALAGGISLVELLDNITLPADVGRVEFKWVWDGRGCAAPPDGQAFEIRIWPDLPGVTPLGVMDASQPDAVVCDAKSGTRSYEVGNLRGAPAVASVGSGHFRWQVALVELSSQRVTAVSEVRAFDLPPAPTTPTLTPTPTPPHVALPPAQGGGVISLELPQDNHVLPQGTNLLEFKWRWSLSSACELPPPGYGFELRIWPDRPDSGPLGAMGDARTRQKDVFCDPSSHVFSYLVTDLKKTPAVEAAGAGRFRWDVVLIQLEPYVVVNLSPSYVFELPGQSKLP